MTRLLFVLLLASPAVAADRYAKQATWTETMLHCRAALAAAHRSNAERSSEARELSWRIQGDFPIQWDWCLQDGNDVPAWLQSSSGTESERKAVERAAAELGTSGRDILQRLRALEVGNVAPTDRCWLDLYVGACEQRRRARLAALVHQVSPIVFTKHRTLRPSFFAYTEGQSDAQNERHFLPGSELCILEMDGIYGQQRVLVSDPHGAIRDPAVSRDGTRVAFAWKKGLDDDDYHLYELNLTSGRIRQLTSGLGFTDYEPAYLPNGDLIFSSTRCVQTVDCWWTEVSNLYTCDPDGQRLRRLSFDQVHAIYPQVRDDGEVLYTRWDYNDRGQIFPQALFQMHPDGTGQTEFYGNNSWFPTTIAHSRGIPGTSKALAILCGHHTSQAGKLAVIDPGKGRQENSGVQLVAPIRATPVERVDDYGQLGELWQYPYPINEEECLVGYAPLGWNGSPRRGGDADFGIYWMDLSGRRELLAWDSRWPCSQPVPVGLRRQPFNQADRVDHTSEFGTYYVQNVEAGLALQGVKPGTIKKLRVIALDFRAAGIGHNGSQGPGGGALVSTPISVGNGSWDVKIVLGDAKVYSDGSALFTVPARTPVYFQALDEDGYAVQTMRSWSTLQPGEYFGCVGCHENKNTAARNSDGGLSLALKAGTQTLAPFYGPPRGFSFPKEIQPILDRHCIRCHSDRSPLKALVEGAKQTPVLEQLHATAPSRQEASNQIAFSLLGTSTADLGSKRNWSDAYLILTQSRLLPTENEIQAFFGNCEGPVVKWISSQSVPEPIPPYSGGAARSRLLAMLKQHHHGVQLAREETEKIACWIDLLVPYCGDYLEANNWTEEEKAKYQHFAAKRSLMAEAERTSLRESADRRPPSKIQEP